MARATDIEAQVAAALRWLERHGKKKTRDGFAGYGITAEKAFGVTVADIRKLGKELGRDHALAAGLWDSGWYEARMLTSFVDEPDKVSPAQMDRWCKDFDNWAICDSVCFHLFDRTPHAFDKVGKWSRWGGEYERRAAFALLASVALHDRSAGDAAFVRCLPLIERAATDERNFVKKGVSWALCAIGERSVALHAESLALARRLAAAAEAAPRFIGKDAQRKLTSPAVKKRLTARQRATAK